MRERPLASVLYPGGSLLPQYYLYHIVGFGRTGRRARPRGARGYPVRVRAQRARPKEWDLEVAQLGGPEVLCLIYTIYFPLVQRKNIRLWAGRSSFESRAGSQTVDRVLADYVKSRTARGRARKCPHPHGAQVRRHVQPAHNRREAGSAPARSTICIWNLAAMAHAGRLYSCPGQGQTHRRGRTAPRDERRTARTRSRTWQKKTIPSSRRAEAGSR